MEPASELLSRVASYGKAGRIDSKFLDLAERVLEGGVSEALKDALAREFQQLADDFCAELQARQNTHDDIDHTACWRGERRRRDYDPLSREYDNEILK